MGPPPPLPVRTGGAAPARPSGARLAASLGLLALLSLPLGTAAQEGAAERLNHFFSETRTLRAEFRQEVFDEEGELIEEATGSVTLARPGRFRWVYREPYEQEVVGDGTQVWVHDADLDQVTVGDMDASIGSTPAMLLYSDRPIEESFEVMATGEEGVMQWIELVPRAEESAFTRVRITLAPEGMRTMELADRFDQTIRIAFTRLERNVDFDEDHFRFVVPAGADLFRR